MPTNLGKVRILKSECSLCSTPFFLLHRMEKRFVVDAGLIVLITFWMSFAMVERCCLVTLSSSTYCRNLLSSRESFGMFVSSTATWRLKIESKKSSGASKRD